MEDMNGFDVKQKTYHVFGKIHSQFLLLMGKI